MCINAHNSLSEHQSRDHITNTYTHTHTPQQPANAFWSDPDSLPDVEPECSVCILHFGNGGAVLTKCKANRLRQRAEALEDQAPSSSYYMKHSLKLAILEQDTPSHSTLWNCRKVRCNNGENVDASVKGMTRYDKTARSLHVLQIASLMWSWLTWSMDQALEALVIGKNWTKTIHQIWIVQMKLQTFANVSTAFALSNCTPIWTQRCAICWKPLSWYRIACFFATRPALAMWTSTRRLLGNQKVKIAVVALGRVLAWKAFNSNLGRLLLMFCHHSPAFRCRRHQLVPGAQWSCLCLLVSIYQFNTRLAGLWPQGWQS